MQIFLAFSVQKKSTEGGGVLGLIFRGLGREHSKLILPLRLLGTSPTLGEEFIYLRWRGGYINIKKLPRQMTW